MYPTVLIKDLGAHVGAVVTLQGWLYGKRGSGKIQFLEVRDGTGICQCVVEAAAADAFAAAERLTQESSLTVTGTVRADARSAGGFELAASAVTPVQVAAEYPISRKAHGIDFLLSHRHLHFRSRRPHALLRIRHTVIRAIRDYFDGHGFVLIDTPILVPGAGEDAQTLFPVEYFDRTVFLTQTGQLYVESACMAFGKVYCFGPTFRAEKSKTRRHLTEFWMVEPELAFAQLDDVLALAEDMTRSVVRAVLQAHAADLAFLGRDTAPLRSVERPFARLTYSEAAELLRSPETRRWLEEDLERKRAEHRAAVEKLTALDAEAAAQTTKAWKKDKLQLELQELTETADDLARDIANAPGHMALAQNFEWGKDLGGSDETILSRRFDTPVFVTHYPRQAKAFYMKVAPEDPRTVRNVDLLAPEGYGEIIGGSQREEDIEVLTRRMRESGLAPEEYEWYLDLRRYGSVPHGGFGLGVERLLSWICGLKHVREAIPFPRTMGRMYP